MGGYLFMIGIIGVVMGLIYVMGNLVDFSKLGVGIVIVFVVIIYGVGFVNMLFLFVVVKLKLMVKL